MFATGNRVQAATTDATSAVLFVVEVTGYVWDLEVVSYGEVRLALVSEGTASRSSTSPTRWR